MSCAFALAQVHAEPLDVDAPIAGVRLPGPGGVLSDLPQTHLVVYPELHLYGGGSLPDGRHRKWVLPCRSPGSGRRHWPDSSATSGCGCCRARCASAAMTGPVQHRRRVLPGLDNCSNGPRPSDRPSLTSIEVQ